MKNNEYEKYEKEEIKSLRQLVRELKSESRKTTWFLAIAAISLLVAVYSVFLR